MALEINRLGVHAELAYYLLQGFGFSKDELEQHRIYCPLITLTSPETTQGLYSFLTNATRLEQLVKVLNTYSFNGLLYALQCFCKGCEDAKGLLWDVPTDAELTQAFDSAISKAVEDFEKEVITFEYCK